MVGFVNTTYIVSETIGTLEVVVQVFNPPDNESLPASFNLNIESVSESAGMCTKLDQCVTNFNTVVNIL